MSVIIRLQRMNQTQRILIVVLVLTLLLLAGYSSVMTSFYAMETKETERLRLKVRELEKEQGNV